VAYSIGRACGPAVTRNRLRRRVRAILREVDQNQPLPAGRLLIGARPEAVELTFEQLTQEISSLVAAIRP
jgi:ribonuclease P protein component